MASAQVLPNSAASSRKQGHLEAGKKRLEEFRKRKAEGRARKVASTGQLQSADTDQYEKFTQSYDHVRDEATLEGDGTAVTESSGFVMAHEERVVSSSQSSAIGSSNGRHDVSSVCNNSKSAVYGDLLQNSVNHEESKYGSSGFSEPVNGYYDHWLEEKNSELSQSRQSKIEPTEGIGSERHTSLDPVHMNPSYDGSINQSSFYSLVKPQSDESRNSLTNFINNPDTSVSYLASTLPEKSGSVSAQNRVGFPITSTNYISSTIYEESAPGVKQYIAGSGNHDKAMGFDTRGSKITDSISRHLNVDGAPWRMAESSSTDSSFMFKSSSNQHPFPSTTSGTTYGRSRPSFLDSLGVPRVSSMSVLPYSETEKADTPVFFNSSKVQGTESPSSNAVEQSLNLSAPDFLSQNELSINSSVSLSDGELLKQGFGDHNADKKHEFPALKKDEDFAALEQHIEDLTQEKFSLQRALDASRALAESLAAENSSLTDSFNQQGKVVNQLKSDMERLQEEIRAQLLALESMRLEYANAQLECNAADERAKILASEVIGLEEKALRVRSNELKLEKHLENLGSENTSYKRKVSILEKERQDFQSTIDALQEEKKLLQSKVRKASANGKVADIKKTPSVNKDVSTSTEDLGVELLKRVDGESSVAEEMLNSTINTVEDSGSSSFLASNVPSSSSPPEDRNFFQSDAYGAIPLDQLRMIENIRSLISELALEKEELMQALVVESSASSELKDLNKDLSQKLEAQTQRLELLTAQRMANENVLVKPIDTHSMHDTTEYADEGDEVVERVLGWIMKLFPGGPAKRRTSKLL